MKRFIGKVVLISPRLTGCVETDCGRRVAFNVASFKIRPAPGQNLWGKRVTFGKISESNFIPEGMLELL
ncbi:MAG: hypothetical protein A2942_01605 [Candidatus Lloydbacteria bacterium RIFCSPLOWO2_01_FULL_50_20]|uniref:Uncharacterized protein n=1 Tax=Candidatus Lloydbacteria bacterium RIFCSPLOWO2_01_FULL_50_20 TaxID=1798665 RepID=A0A1G2DJ82_9BACT|nr:MAG: hypothetical protein A3C13_03710 [Candidatus Lloydbacteria bacterium RIFCSPHIGHO2_02_FULL_50_11]OGZ12868.1 MAG: hypothetical protein A2942_01605 [Candidatus Lloydbacteria bacterium RIFCSPLOWO2_01_FULL_50_20]